MNKDERRSWAWIIAYLAIFMAFSLGGFLGSGGQSEGFGILLFMFGVIFGTVVMVWLFRVTFLAGRRYG